MIKLFTKPSLIALLFLGILNLLVACGGGSSESLVQPALSNTYEGVAQKGPFSIGALVTIAELDDQGAQTGNSIQTRIQDLTGRFSYELPISWEVETGKHAIQITVEGYPVEETSGEASNHKVKLGSITKDPAHSSVNLLTEWAQQRARFLLSEGNTLSHALNKAEQELVSILGIHNSHQLDLSQAQNYPADNAQLLLLSGALVELASHKKIQPQKIIDEFAKDFREDGKLNALGDAWFKRMQALIRDNPKAHVNYYASALKQKQGWSAPQGGLLPRLIPLASRPVANVTPEIQARPGETIILDGSASNDSGNIINFTWFRIDQQTQYKVPLSNRFIASPTITTPDIGVVSAAPNRQISLLYALVVTDVDKLTHTATVKVVVSIPPPVVETNSPPVADSRLQNTNNAINTDEDTPVAFTLTGSDPDGDPITFLVPGLPGSPLLLSHGIVDVNGALPDLIYTPTLNNTLGDSFTFMVNDGTLNSQPATVELTVNPINDLPVANAGPDQAIDSGQTVNLAGSGTDVDGTILSYQWTQPNGITVTLSDATSATPVFTAPLVSSIAEVLTFDLVVTDNDLGVSAPDSVSITVNPVIPNSPPTADAGIDQTVLSQSSVILDGSASTDSDGTITDYAWTQSGGPPVTLTPVTAIGDRVTFTAPTVPDTSIFLTFQLVVTDNDGASSVADTVTIIVQKNDPPVAETVLIQQLAEPININLADYVTDPENDLLSYEIVAVEDGIGNPDPIITFDFSSLPTVLASNPLDIPVDRYFDYRATDTAGNVSNTGRITVRFVNQSPVALIKQSVPNAIINQPFSLSDGGSFDPDNNLVFPFVWSISTSPVNAIVTLQPNPDGTLVSITTDTPGLYTFTLTVEDDLGYTDSTSINVTVN